ncbi:hypothetical protein BDZ94DRAFT_892841 [Collybia nuda]|uniref:Uncharacterized protein n=1 Tax=Collybia nuda TaxID=64659 RepID=A0A9P5XZF5_9AGAR|nr:hypothetical protein BDZ94DRAFT_1008529 [Collybia nuda]KAF9460624.1 hypothetical protein BDZ94DRAFT_892841 [Collybia nuda]
MASTETINTPPPGLQQAIPYLLSAGSAILSGISVVSRFFVALLSTTTRSILFFSPLPILLYVLAPVIVFFELVVDTFIRLPLGVTMYLLDAFYPVYVFCGVACIVGGLMGLFGRLLSKFVVDLVMNGYPPVEEVKPEVEDARPPRRHKRRKIKVEE